MPKLTQPTIDKYKPLPDGKVRTVPDTGCPGLYLLVHPTRKSWVVMYRRRSDRKQRKLTLHGFPSLAIAHKLTRETLNKVAEGGDPAAEKQESKRAAGLVRIDRVDDAFLEFMDKYVTTKGKGRHKIRESTRRETGRLLGFKRDPNKPDTWIKSGGGVLSEWQGRRLDAIKSADVRDLLDKLVKRGPVMANRTLAALKTCFTWHVRREALDKSPCDIGDPPGAEGKGRKRVLTDKELAALWRAADAEGYAFGRMVQLLILTGCRRNEVRGAHWSEFDLDKREWLIPGERTKNGYEHLVPLSDRAMTIIKDLPRILDRRSNDPLLFTTTGKTPISGLSKIKARVAKAMAKKLGEEPPRWTLHDIRRTVVTGLQELGVDRDTREAVVNHHIGGVAGVYSHHDYATEKRAALEAWAQHVDSIVAGKSAKVIPLRTKPR